MYAFWWAGSLSYVSHNCGINYLFPWFIIFGIFFFIYFCRRLWNNFKVKKREPEEIFKFYSSPNMHFYFQELKKTLQIKKKKTMPIQSELKIIYGTRSHNIEISHLIKIKEGRKQPELTFSCRHQLWVHSYWKRAHQAGNPYERNQFVSMFQRLPCTGSQRMANCVVSFTGYCYKCPSRHTYRTC